MASKAYKYKSLRVFSSSEWMVDSTKKYRRVFDKSEISYLRAELSFYNKNILDNSQEKTLVKVYLNTNADKNVNMPIL